MLQDEMEQELVGDEEFVKSPTVDFHRPQVSHFPSLREEDEEEGQQQQHGDLNV